MSGRIRLAAVVLVLLLIPVIWAFPPDETAPGATARKTADLDGDGVQEEYLLAAHRLTVTEGGREIWQSDPAWTVDHFAIGDPDNDGTDNLVISLWKEGSFGEIRPFWMTGEDDSYKNHLFLLKLADKKFRSVWCSSDLDCPIASFDVRDEDGDGRFELVIQEGRYRETGDRYALDPDIPVRTTVWQWEEWGFRRAEYSAENRTRF